MLEKKPNLSYHVGMLNNLRYWKLIFINLSIAFSSSLLADCTGCCANNGGPVCLSGLTICKDKTPMSLECLEQNCDLCSGDSSVTQVKKNTSKYKKRFQEFPQSFSDKDQAMKFLYRVYAKGGSTFFCNKKFKSPGKILWREVVQLPEDAPMEAKADPINLTPVTRKCFDVTRPRKSARGDLVRIYRYMEDKYGLKLIPADKANEYSLWTLNDPADLAECQRILDHGNGLIPKGYRHFCKRE